MKKLRQDKEKESSLPITPRTPRRRVRFDLSDDGKKKKPKKKMLSPAPPVDLSSNSSVVSSSSSRRRRRCNKDEGSSLVAAGDAPFASVVSTWCQLEEFMEMRRDAIGVMQQVRDGKCDTVWEQARQHSYRKCLERVYRWCIRDKDLEGSTLESDLAFWATVGHSRRGLERFVFEDTFGKMRDETRTRVIEGVLFVQKKCRDEGMTLEQAQRLIYAASELQSRPARRFAECMGKADRTAVDTEVGIDEMATEAAEARAAEISRRKKKKKKRSSRGSAGSVASSVASSMAPSMASTRSRRRPRNRRRSSGSTATTEFSEGEELGTTRVLNPAA